MKQSDRIKLPVPSLRTRADAEAAASRYAQAVNARRQVAAWRDDEILRINERYAPDLARYEAQIEAEAEALQRWADAHPDEFPRDRKSLALPNAVIGYRTGTPAVRLLSRSWSWDKVLDAVKARVLPWIRVKEEVDKESVLAFHRDQPDRAADILAGVGLKVVQEETFFVEPVLDDAKPDTVIKSKPQK